MQTVQQLQVSKLCFNGAENVHTATSAEVQMETLQRLQ
jgi:hypothetical protein